MMLLAVGGVNVVEARCCGGNDTYGAPLEEGFIALYDTSDEQGIGVLNPFGSEVRTIQTYDFADLLC